MPGNLRSCTERLYCGEMRKSLDITIILTLTSGQLCRWYLFLKCGAPRDNNNNALNLRAYFDLRATFTTSSTSSSSDSSSAGGSSSHFKNSDKLKSASVFPTASSDFSSSSA